MPTFLSLIPEISWLDHWSNICNHCWVNTVWSDPMLTFCHSNIWKKNLFALWIVGWMGESTVVITRQVALAGSGEAANVPEALDE